MKQHRNLNKKPTAANLDALTSSHIDFLRTFKTSDGRTISYHDGGNFDGIPVIFFHGIPGSHEQGLRIISHAQQLRMIGVDRPGVGRSSPNTKGTLRAFAQDLKELLAELKIEKVRLLGLSGGAPYALAAAHDLGSVVEKVALVCPLGPLAVPEVFASMSEGMRKTFERHRQSPVLSKIIIKFWRFAFLLQPKACHRMLARTYSPVDQETLTNEELAGYIRNSFITAFEQGVDAVLMDATNYLSVWDFDLKDISVPITVWHGGQDVVVPPAVGRWYAKNLPNATLQLLDEHGHFSLPGLHQKAIFDDLLSKSITT